MVDGCTRLGFEVAVGFDFDFDSSHVSTPFVLYRKWKLFGEAKRCVAAGLPSACDLKWRMHVFEKIGPKNNTNLKLIHAIVAENASEAPARWIPAKDTLE